MPSLKCQFKNELKGRLVYGISKHNATPKELKEKIFSKSTLNAYIRHSETFVRFLKKNNLSVSTIEAAKQFVPAFLDAEINAGKSSYTIKAEACALAKVYRCSSNDFGVDLPKRSRKKITNNRGKSEYAKHFSEIRHSDIVSFAKSTGLRREGLNKVKGTDIRIDLNGKVLVHTKEKGGREREVPMYFSDDAVYREALQIAIKHMGRDEKIFDHVSKAAPTHRYRRAYAQSLYEHLARDVSTLPTKELYICRKELSGRKYDNLALKTVSEALGHSRLNVVVNDYLN